MKTEFRLQPVPHLLVWRLEARYFDDTDYVEYHEYPYKPAPHWSRWNQLGPDFTHKETAMAWLNQYKEFPTEVINIE